jgi:hypothetical protein
MRKDSGMDRQALEVKRVERTAAETLADAAGGWKLTYEWDSNHYREGDPPTRILHASGGRLVVLFDTEKTRDLSDGELRRQLRTAWDEELALVRPDRAVDP